MTETRLLLVSNRVILGGGGKKKGKEGREEENGKGSRGGGRMGARTGDRIRACNYAKIKTGRNFPLVLKIVTHTVQAV